MPHFKIQFSTIFFLFLKKMYIHPISSNMQASDQNAIATSNDGINKAEQDNQGFLDVLPRTSICRPS